MFARTLIGQKLFIATTALKPRGGRTTESAHATFEAQGDEPGPGGDDERSQPNGKGKTGQRKAGKVSQHNNLLPVKPREPATGMSEL